MVANQLAPTRQVTFAYHLINPRNAAFIEGRSPHIDSNANWLLVISGSGLWFLFAALTVSMILAIIEALVTGDEMRARVPALLIMLAATAFFTYLIYPALRDALRERRSARNGHLLPGEATSFTRHGDALRVGYRFRTPEGRERSGITGTLQALGARPRPNEHLVILYLNDSVHKAL